MTNRRTWTTLGVTLVLVACSPGDQTRALGPVDGHDLPGVALERVAVGDVAPDFSLESFSGDTVALSDFRGEKNVVLVFYRGHW